MDFTLMNLILVFGAGVVSVLSPCVLPVVPIIVTGREDDSKWRPIFIIAGLTATFIAMGVISSLFGGLIAGKMILFEKIAGVLILLFGLLMIFDINIFKHITFFNRFQQNGVRKQGNIAGLVMGISLGLIWIPCVGPMLSSVLATVATAGKIPTGIFLLTIYSAGFAVPMLTAAYATSFFRNRVASMKSNPIILRVINGTVLIIFGIYILVVGVINFGY